MSFGINRTLFACTVHRFASLKRLTTYTSATSCSMRRAVAWNWNSPLCCWVISLTHCMDGSFQIRNQIFFKFANLLQGHSAQPKSSLFCGELRCLWIFLLPTFLVFLYFCLTLQHSPPSSCLCISHIFLIIDVIYYSDHFAVCSFPSKITTTLNLNWVKNILSGDFVWCYIFMMYLT